MRVFLYELFRSGDQGNYEMVDNVVVGNDASDAFLSTLLQTSNSARTASV